MSQSTHRYRWRPPAETIRPKLLVPTPEGIIHIARKIGGNDGSIFLEWLNVDIRRVRMELTLRRTETLEERGIPGIGSIEEYRRLRNYYKLFIPPRGEIQSILDGGARDGNGMESQLRETDGFLAGLESEIDRVIEEFRATTPEGEIRPRTPLTVASEARLVQAIRDRDRAIQTAAAAQREVERLKQELEALHSESAQGERNAALREMESVRAELERVVSHCASLSQEKESLQGQLEETRTSLTEEIARLRLELAAWDAGTSATISIIETALVEAENRLRETDEAIVALVAENEELRTQLGTARSSS